MVCSEAGSVSVLAAVVAGRIELGGGRVESSGVVGRRGGTIQGGGNGTGIDNGLGIRAGWTK